MAPWFIGDPHGFVTTNCAGRIHLENVSIDGGGMPNGQVSFTDCADVSIHWGTLAAEGQPVNFVRSRARIANSVVFGKQPAPVHPAAPWTEAMRVENGEVRLVGSLVRGGDRPATTGMAGIVLANGTVYAGPGARILPGDNIGCGWITCTMGLGATGTGTIWLDPDSFVWTLPPTVPWYSLEQPSTSLALVTRGQSFRALVAGPRGGFALLALGLPSWGPSPTPLGNLWLDPNLILHVGAGPIDATTGLLDQTYTCWSGVPMDLLLCYQGGVIWPDGRVALTEPVRFTVQWPVGQSWP